MKKEILIMLAVLGALGNNGARATVSMDMVNVGNAS